MDSLVNKIFDVHVKFWKNHILKWYDTFYFNVWINKGLQFKYISFNL